jgi:dihydropyrimidinase
MQIMDLIIRNGEVVTSDGSIGQVDLAILDGIIAQMGGTLKGKQELNASGMLIFPGGIDAHVHLSIPEEERDEPHWVDDFYSGSAAAFAGGITTLGNMTFAKPGETPLASLKRESALAQSQTMADLFLHPVILEPTASVLDEIPQLPEAGCNTIKLFMVLPWFDTQLSSFLDAIQRAGAHGLLTMIHCEDHALIKMATDRLMEAGKSSLRYYPESRPVISELVATQRAIALAEITGAPIYVVHLSSADALQVCRAAQSRNLPIYVETRPIYLHLTRERYEERDGAKYVGQPPLREQSDANALWAAIQQGTIHTVCTDHAPWTLAAKLDPAHTITNLRPGVADLQTMLPMLYSQGVRSGRISPSRFVQVTSTNASKLFGLFPGKGTIAVGSDADLVIFDPNLTRRIEPSMLKSRSDYSVYEGWQVTGWPIITLRRGEVVFEQDEIIAKPASGRLVRRGKTLPL